MALKLDYDPLMGKQGITRAAVGVMVTDCRVSCYSANEDRTLKKMKPSHN